MAAAGSSSSKKEKLQFALDVKNDVINDNKQSIAEYKKHNVSEEKKINELEKSPYKNTYMGRNIPEQIKKHKATIHYNNKQIQLHEVMIRQAEIDYRDAVYEINQEYKGVRRSRKRKSSKRKKTLSCKK